MTNELRGFAKVKGDRQLKKITRTDKWFTYFNDGTKELDLQMGGSSFILGYNNPSVTKNLEKNILDTARCQSNNYHYNDATERAGKILCDDIWHSYAWALSGTSSVEAAISMNDEYWKQLGKSKPKIISFSFAWHGTSFLTKDMGAPFLLDNHTGRCINLPHPKSREEEIKTIEKILLDTDLSDVGCIVFDSVAWINGLYSWSEKWWQDIRNICNTHDILMITDDVAACWGKTKSLHPFQTIGYNIQPDISALGKSLTAGYAPLGAAVCNKKVGEVISVKGAWNYNHTWQPSMIGIYLMLNVYDFIVDNSLLSYTNHVEDSLRYLGQKLLDENHIDNFRVVGTFFAFDVKKEAEHTGLSSTLFKNHIRGCAPLIASPEYFRDLEDYLYGSYT
jgi:adenosylmethionine-8-amino-7-oxononanoate aminotransferase